MRFQHALLTAGKTGRIIRNAIFWALFAAWHVSSRNRFWPDYPALLAVILLSFGPGGYLHNLWIIPRFLLRRRYVSYSALLLLTVALTAVLSFYLTRAVNSLVPGLDYMGASKDVALPYHAFPAVLVLAMLAFGKFMADAVSNHQRLEWLEKGRLESELQSLRSQVNPHFLFNALNTIYGMARRTDQETADAVIKLSDILRHSLYDCEEAQISLEKETRFLQQYVHFAQLRLHERSRISLTIDAAPDGHSLAPLLLLPFIENAFKHGLARHSYSSWVEIRLQLSGNKLHFRCRNSKDASGTRAGGDTGGGIGLKNVQRRLELLYPGLHRLRISDEDDIYDVSLELELG